MIDACSGWDFAFSEGVCRAGSAVGHCGTGEMAGKLSDRVQKKIDRGAMIELTEKGEKVGRSASAVFGGAVQIGIGQISAGMRCD